MKTITKFEDLNINPDYKQQREDYRCIKLAVERGWTVDASQNTQKGLTFHRGVKHIWQAKYHWQTANLIGGRYQSHKPFEYLKDALLSGDTT